MNSRSALERQVRVHAACAVADEAGDLVYVAGLGGFADHAGLHALAHAAQVMVHGAHGDEHRHGHGLVIHALVRKNDDAVLSIDRLFDFLADALHSLAETFLALGERPGAVDRLRRILTAKGAEFLEFGIEEDRRIHHDLATRFGVLGKQVALPAHDGVKRHDELLADRVDRRVRHLCEELREVGVKQARLEREDGQRRGRHPSSRRPRPRP